MRFWAALLACAALVGSAACGEETDDGSDDDAHEDHDAHAGHDAGDDEELEEVPCTPDYPTFRPDLTVAEGGLTLRLLAVDPAPPRQKVPNDWVLQVEDGSGAPVPEFDVQSARTWMEVHGHAGRTDPMVVEQPEPGQFKLDNLNFHMRGPWLVMFSVKPASGTTVPVRFKICVE